MMKINQKYHTPVGIFNHIQLKCEPSIRLVLTGECNLACDFCIYKIRNYFSPEIKSSTFRNMKSSEQLANTLIKLNSQLNYNITHLTGGEPTTSKNLLQIAELCSKIGYSINIVSNLVDIHPIIEMCERNLLNELTFSYSYLNGKYNGLRKKVEQNIKILQVNFPEIKVKSNIIISSDTVLKLAERFIFWCWKCGISVRLQRDRSFNRINISNIKTVNLLKQLSMEPESVEIRVPGATELCKFKSSKGNLIVKVFNLNFRPFELCRNCERLTYCNKALSSIRIYQREKDVRLCICTERDENQYHMKIDEFLQYPVFDEFKNYRENNMLYFEKYCDNLNFQ